VLTAVPEGELKARCESQGGETVLNRRGETNPGTVEVLVSLPAYSRVGAARNAGVAVMVPPVASGASRHPGVKASSAAVTGGAMPPGLPANGAVTAASFPEGLADVAVVPTEDSVLVVAPTGGAVAVVAGCGSRVPAAADRVAAADPVAAAVRVADDAELEHPL